MTSQEVWLDPKGKCSSTEYILKRIYIYIHTSPEIFHFIACGHFAYLAKYHFHCEICNFCIGIYRQQLPFMDLFRYPSESVHQSAKIWGSNGGLCKRCPGEMIQMWIQTKTISTERMWKI